jgi:hypothetical protein
MKIKKLALVFLALALVAVTALSGCGAVAHLIGLGESEPSLAISAPEQQAIIDKAVAYQTEGGVYNADSYIVTQLEKGAVIYGMLPGQSVFYTDKGTVDAGKGSYKAMYSLMQIRPHPVYGYRTKLGKYEVLQDMYVATGKCFANETITVDGVTETLGEGGAIQHVIFDYETSLKLLEEIDLHE